VADEPPKSTPPKGPTFTQTVVEHPTEVAQLIEAIEGAFDRYASNREKHYRQVATAQARVVSHIIWVTLAVVAVAVVATAILAYHGIVTGDAFTFVVGTVVGSLIAFMAQNIAPNLLAEEIVEE
jgi:hypothetical protein